MEIRKLKSAVTDESGFTNLQMLVIILVVFIFISAMMIFTNVYTKMSVAKKTLRGAIVSCEIANYDKQYQSLIEAESYMDTGNYDDDSYRAGFFNCMDSSFNHVTKTGTDNNITYAVMNQSGQPAFTLDGLSLNIVPKEVTLHDAKTKRLVYTATCNLEIPFGGFGYYTTITIPVTVTASYQYTA